jgi:glycosyltransferase involved in cell wall biosynthesis
MKVYLHTAKIDPHWVYKELMDFPPVPYHSFRQFELFNCFLSRFLISLGLPKLNYLPLKGFDLVHSCQNIIINDFPYVVDMVDHVVGFGNSRNCRHLLNKKFTRLVEHYLSSQNCKKILPATEYHRESLRTYLDISRFKEKIEVVYPAHHKVEVDMRKRGGDTVHLLFIGNRFYAKGGREVLEAFEVLRNRYRVRLTMICSDIPDEVRARYASCQDLSLLPRLLPGRRLKLTVRNTITRLGWPVYQALPRDEIIRLYEQADIFVLPDFMDSMVVYPEAMAHGIPVVSTDSPPTPEFVEDGVTGFLIPSPIFFLGKGLLKRWMDWYSFVEIIKKSEFPAMVGALVEKLSILIENRDVRERMGAEAKRRVDEGKFSLGERNRKLSKIYEEAITG